METALQIAVRKVCVGVAQIISRITPYVIRDGQQIPVDKNHPFLKLMDEYIKRKYGV